VRREASRHGGQPRPRALHAAPACRRHVIPISLPQPPPSPPIFETRRHGPVRISTDAGAKGEGRRRHKRRMPCGARSSLFPADSKPTHVARGRRRSLGAAHEAPERAWAKKTQDAAGAAVLGG